MKKNSTVAVGRKQILKDDRLDARTLARLASIDPGLLGPVKHRSAEAQIHLRVIRERATLVNAASGLTKSYGERKDLGKISSHLLKT